MRTLSALWLYLHFPLLPLEMRYTCARPGPAALLDERRARLWLCNQDAADAGLKPGMAIATACSICPEVQLLNRQAQQEPQQLESLALWAGSFSAQVALQEPHGLLLEVASMLHYFQGLEELYRQLQAQLEPLGFSAQLATGHTPRAARLLAQACVELISDQADEHLACLSQLPVSLLELDAKTKERLNGMGLERLEQLLTLPREALAARLGPQLLDYLDRLTGQRPDPPRYFDPPPQFRRHLELGHEAESTQALLFPLRRLLAELEGYLKSRQLQALQLQLELQERETQGQRISIGHAEGAHHSSSWLALCQLRLERVDLQQPVVALQLEVSRFREQAEGSQDLFMAEAPAESPQQLLSRLQTRLGDDCVQRLGLMADHRPERSWQALRPDQSYSKQPALPGRPCWLLSQPEPIRPVQIEQQRIRLLKGPERIVSGWWDAQPVRRDYYTARWPDGRLGWLFRDDRGNWYLHGWFG